MGEDLPVREYPKSEATRSPIFLLQQRRWMFGEEPPGWMIVADLIENEEDDEEHLPLTYEACGERFREFIVEWWDTVSIFFTREEAEAYGRSRSHRYLDGWRVYCVHAEGELADLLKAHTVKPRARERLERAEDQPREEVRDGE